MIKAYSDDTDPEKTKEVCENNRQGYDFYANPHSFLL